MSITEAYHEKMEAQLKEWGVKIDQLRQKVEHVSADLKPKYREHLETLREKQHEARRKLRELKTAGENVWEEVQEGMEQAKKELRELCEKVREKFQ